MLPGSHDSPGATLPGLSIERAAGMTTRAERTITNPDLGMLAGRLLFAVQGELFAALAAKGFDDILPRHGAVLAYLEPEGVRAPELSRLSGQHKQVIGTLIDELERLGY